MKTFISLDPMPNVRPKGMEMIAVDRETSDSLKEISMEIYIDMVNAGKSLQDILATIYISGLIHGQRLSKGLDNE